MVWRVPVKALEKQYLNQYMKNEWSQFCMWLRAGDFAQENPHCRGQILCLSCISELITNFELLKLSYECQNIVGCFHLPAYMVPPCGHWEWGRSVFLSPSQQENYNGWQKFDRLEGDSCWFRGTWNRHSRFASHVTSVWRVSEQKALSRLLLSAVVADSYRCIVHTGWESRREGLRSQSLAGQQRHMRTVKF